MLAHTAYDLVGGPIVALLLCIPFVASPIFGLLVCARRHGAEFASRWTAHVIIYIVVTIMILILLEKLPVCGSLAIGPILGLVIALSRPHDRDPAE